MGKMNQLDIERQNEEMELEQKIVFETRIRSRKSYQHFKEIYRFLKRKPRNKTILHKFFSVLDEKYAFGSVKQSLYAEESLKLLIKDEQSRGGKNSKI